MKYIFQFGVILVFSFIGEILHVVIPLPVPASIYGLVIVFLCLELKIIRVSTIKAVSQFLIEIMPLMFIPVTVGLLDSWGALRPIFFPVLLITVVSTVLVMGVSGRVTQGVIRLENKGGMRK